MVQTLRFQDEKSDKFWRVETLGCEMVVNWGKTGTSGRYEIKEFQEETECKRQAEKLILSKKKKGYVDMPDFDCNQHLYFDTEEYGPHQLTSHPIFRTYFSDDLYYDCGDEEAPFGSDEGNDTLWSLQEAIRKKPKMDFSSFPKQLIEKEWGLTYLPPIPEQTEEELKAQAAQDYQGLSGEQELLQTDQVILAAAFGQVKVTGKLDKALQKLALLSLCRMAKMERLFWNWKEETPSYAIQIMRQDLERFIQKIQQGE